MRRSIALATAALATVLSLPVASPVAAVTPRALGDDGHAAQPALPAQAAAQALATATRVLSGQAKSGDAEATLALRDLRLALPSSPPATGTRPRGCSPGPPRAPMIPSTTATPARPSTPAPSTSASTG
ncbi:MAG: hypothetical protein R2734_06230 [Nocardioides sp.]